MTHTGNFSTLDTDTRHSFNLGHILGHSATLQLFSSDHAPVQFFPNRGRGLSHSRARVWTPGPHVALHSVQVPQAPQPPSTGEWTLLSPLGGIRGPRAHTAQQLTQVILLWTIPMSRDYSGLSPTAPLIGSPRRGGLLYQSTVLNDSSMLVRPVTGTLKYCACDCHCCRPFVTICTYPSMHHGNVRP